jgi:hypothetical protein
VGDEAPDFALPAATREGVSARPLRLSELKGTTVVLARSLFVVGLDGRVTYRQMPFRKVDPRAYVELGKAIDLKGR